MSKTYEITDDFLKDLHRYVCKEIQNVLEKHYPEVFALKWPLGYEDYGVFLLKNGYEVYVHDSLLGFFRKYVSFGKAPKNYTRYIGLGGCNFEKLLPSWIKRRSY